MRSEETHSFEGKILWQNERQWLVETTIPLANGHYKYWVPKKCCLTNCESGDGNFMFIMNDWWYRKMINGDFRADQ